MATKMAWANEEAGSKGTDGGAEARSSYETPRAASVGEVPCGGALPVTKLSDVGSNVAVGDDAHEEAGKGDTTPDRWIDESLGAVSRTSLPPGQWFVEGRAPPAAAFDFSSIAQFPLTSRALDCINQALEKETNAADGLPEGKRCARCRRRLARKYFTAPQWRKAEDGRCRECTGYWDGFEHLA